MDPVTAKMALQILSTLARSKKIRSLVIGVLALGLIIPGALLFGAMTLASRMASQLSTQQTMGMAACTTGTAASLTAKPAAGGLDAEQQGNARTIWQVANRLPGVGDHGAVVGIATAMQESTLYNVAHGDRAGPDSRGLFQQRNSWGPLSVRMDPAGAAGLFFAALVKIPNWATLPVTAAAQKVQISAYPNAYAAHQAAAEGLVALFRSGSPAAAAATCGLMPAVRVATWNTYVGPRYSGRGPTDTARVTFGMLAISRDADIISTQEMSDVDRRKAAQNGLGDGWADVGMATAQPIFYRTTRFALIDQTVTLVYKRGDPIEGPDQGNRWVVAAHLRDITTGQTLTVANTHQLPPAGVEVGSPSRPHRAAMARRIYAMAVTAATAHPEGGALLTCDCNSDVDLDGFAAVAGLTRALDVFGNPSQATRSHTIDQIMWKGGTPTTQTVLDSYGSDHSARVVTFPAPTQDSDNATGNDADPGGTAPADYDKLGNPRTVEQAIAWFLDAAPHGAAGEPVVGRCERYQNLAYGLGGGYPSAIAHWNAPGQRSTTATPPRGSLVFFASSAHNEYGHVAMSLGGGQAISTDFWHGRYTPGTIGVGSVASIAKAMGHPYLGYRAPAFPGSGR